MAISFSLAPLSCYYATPSVQQVANAIVLSTGSLDKRDDASNGKTYKYASQGTSFLAKLGGLNHVYVLTGVYLAGKQYVDNGTFDNHLSALDVQVKGKFYQIWLKPAPQQRLWHAARVVQIVQPQTPPNPNPVHPPAPIGNNATLQNAFLPPVPAVQLRASNSNDNYNNVNLPNPNDNYNNIPTGTGQYGVPVPVHQIGQPVSNYQNTSVVNSLNNNYQSL
jgi:hypothetical protein